MKQRSWARRLALPALVTTVVITLAACGQITTPASTQPETPIRVTAQALDWQITTVLDVGTEYPGEVRTSGTAVALDAEGNPHIVYDFVTGSYPSWTNLMKYASNDSTDGWTTEDVPGQEPENGSFSLVFYAGTPHIAFAHGGSLYYASPDSSGSGWTVTTVDTVSEDYIPSTSLAFDGYGNPHIAYANSIYSSFSGVLRYVSYDSTSGWTDPVTVYNPDPTASYRHAGDYPSLAFDNDGVPHISSQDWDGSAKVGVLVYSSYDPTTEQWNTVSVDGGDATYTEIGEHSSLAFDGGNHPHISYKAAKSVDSGGNSELRYARHDGSAWQLSVVDDSADFAGRDSSLALDGDGHPHINYVDTDESESETLMYAWYDGSSWQTDAVDTAASCNSLAFDPTNNKVYIAYVDGDTSGNLMLAVGTTETVSPEVAIDQLIGSVNDLGLKTGQARGLTNPLDNALRSLEKGRTDDAYNQLQDFIAKVQAKTPTPVSTEIASELISAAEAIEASLGY